MTKLLYPTMLLLLVATLLIWANPWGPGRAYSAEPEKVLPKDISSQAEPSPEEAAGGKENLQRMRKACDEDAKKLCPDIRPGGGRILQCLHGHESSLSPACRQALAPRSSNP